MTVSQTQFDEPTTEYAVLFDMDGVILKGRGSDPSVHERALDDAIAAHGLELTDEQRESLRHYEFTPEFADACETVGVDPGEFFRTRERFAADRSIARLRSGSRRPYDDIAVLDQLADTHTLGLVSNNYHATVSFVVDHFDIDVFGYVRGRDPGIEGFEKRKPEPDYLNGALDTIEASSGLYVGDRETDLIAAERAGLDGVLLRREHNRGLEPSVEPMAVIDSLDGLPGIVA